MLQGLVRRDALLRIPIETPHDEVEECFALVPDYFDERSGPWKSEPAVLVLENVQWLVGAWAEEFIFALGVLEDRERRHAEYLHDKRQLLHLTLTWENWDARIQLNQDAAEAPHVDACRVRDANYNLRCPVEAGLYVRVNPLVGEARGPEVDDFDARLIWTLQQDILWLQVAVDDVLVSEELERLQDLNGEAAYQRKGDALEVVVLDELVKIDREELERDYQVVAEYAVILDLDDVVLILGVLPLEVL